MRSLPYISEACVLAVPSHSTKQSCAAVIRLRRHVASAEQGTLARIRHDLEGSLAYYMMPVLLRILSEEEDVPVTVSGKPVKGQILKDYFGSVGGIPAEIMPPGVEVYTFQETAETKTKTWDWCGLQCAE